MANTLKFSRNGPVGFIDWLDGSRATPPKQGPYESCVAPRCWTTIEPPPPPQQQPPISSIFDYTTYCLTWFVVTLLIAIGVGISRSLMSGGHPNAIVPPPAVMSPTKAVTFWLLMRSFASGCTAMTGVEAVSNGVPLFAEPRVKRAEWTLTIIVATLAILLAGIAYLSRAYHIGAMDQQQAGYQSIISQVVAAVLGRGPIYYITIASVLSALVLSANTSFADFPRVCRLLTEDDFLPAGFVNRGRRLVYSLGIGVLALISGIILIAFGGITDKLIPLFAVGAFGAFTLSQAGMVDGKRNYQLLRFHCNFTGCPLRLRKKFSWRSRTFCSSTLWVTRSW